MISRNNANHRWIGHFKRWVLNLLKPNSKRSLTRSIVEKIPSLSDTLKLTAPYIQGEAVKTLQYNLIDIGIDVSVDGAFGPSTEAAVRAFQQAHGLTADGIAGSITLQKIRKEKQERFNASAQTAQSENGRSLPGWTGGDKIATIEAIKQAAKQQGVVERSHIAYILATVEHETGGTFQPVEEGCYLAKAAAVAHRKSLRYYPYYGRGYVQLTWADNYYQYSALTGLDLLNQPELMLRPDISLFVLIDGMKRGIFTGRSLADFTRVNHFDFVEARRIINGKDKAESIAGLAHSWLAEIG